MLLNIKSGHLLVLFGFFAECSCLQHRMRDDAFVLKQFEKHVEQTSHVEFLKSDSLKPGSTAKTFEMWTLHHGLVTYPSDQLSSDVPIGFHAFTNDSGFLEAMWTGNDSLIDFVQTSPENVRYVFMTFDENAVEVVSWMEKAISSALMKSVLSQQRQKQFLDQCYFVVTPIFEIGNWISDILDQWACSGHGCNFDQVLFHSDVWTPPIKITKRLDARYDWAVSHQWTPSTVPISLPLSACKVADINVTAVKGTAALVSDDTSKCSIASKAANLQKSGAVGVLVYSKPGYPLQDINCYGSDCNSPISIPVINIPYNEELITILSSGKEKLTAQLQTTTSPNFYFTIGSGGNLTEAGWFLYPSLQFLGWQMQWLVFSMNLQQNISKLNDYVVPVFDKAVMQGKNGTGFSSLLLHDLQQYESLYLDARLGCVGDMDSDCPPWDHVAKLYVSCNHSAVQTEIGRWITSFRRGIGHWLTDVSPLLPVLLPNSGTTAQCSFLMKVDAWWAQPWLASVTLRFKKKSSSTAPVGVIAAGPLPQPYASEVVPLFEGGTFDKNYNKKYHPLQFMPPPSAKKVVIFAVISGHGSDNNNCAEFCVTSHHFVVNNNSYVKTFSNAGTPLGCAEHVPEGVVPNEHGTWLYGRDGWCDGQQVIPWVIDITSNVRAGSSNTVTYYGYFNGADPKPTQNPGLIRMVSFLVYYDTILMTSVLRFGPKLIPISTTFLRTSLSYAVVNIKPVVPGHVLICSLRVVPRFKDLRRDEVTDLFLCAQRVATAVEKFYSATSVSIVVQDGPEAGQSIPHVHVHVLPRVAGDFFDNDEIYTKLQSHDKPDVNGAVPNLRSVQEMEEEAASLKSFMESLLNHETT